MQRDMHLIRAILMGVEQRSEADAGRPIVIEGYDEEAIRYHTWLAVDSGLIDADEVHPYDDILFRSHKLTTEGQSFVDLARDEDTWNRALRRCELCIRTIPFDVFHTMMAYEAVMALGT